MFRLDFRMRMNGWRFVHALGVKDSRALEEIWVKHKNLGLVGRHS